LAAVLLLGTPTYTTANNAAKSVTATPTAGDLIVLVVANSGATSGTAPTDDNADGLGTYTLAETALLATSTHYLSVYIRDALIGSATSTIFTNNNTSNTGGGIAVLRVTGMTKTGATAEVQSAKQDSQAAGTPAPVMGAAVTTTNPVIMAAVVNDNSPGHDGTSGLVPRTSHTELVDQGYSTPTSGLYVTHINSGETGTTLTWGGAATAAYGALAVELDASSSGSSATATPTTGSAVAEGRAPGEYRELNQGGTVGLATLAGRAPTLALELTITPTQGLATLEGRTPSTYSELTVTPTQGTLTTEGRAPDEYRELTIAPTQGLAIVNGRTPTVVDSSAPVTATVEPGVGALTLAEQAPTLLPSTTVEPDVGAAVLYGQSVTLDAVSASATDTIRGHGGTRWRSRNYGPTYTDAELSVGATVAAGPTDPPDPLPPMPVVVAVLPQPELTTILDRVAALETKAARRARMRREDEELIQILMRVA
jgi:hypothetical protein